MRHFNISTPPFLRYVSSRIMLQTGNSQKVSKLTEFFFRLKIIILYPYPLCKLYFRISYDSLFYTISYPSIAMILMSTKLSMGIRMINLADMF